MIINTESTVGYNNKDRKANSSMKLGVNSDVNIEQKPLRIKHNLGPSKVNHYNQKAKSPKKSEETESVTMKPPMAKLQTQTTPKDVHGFNSQHELNLALIIVSIGG